MGNIKNKKIKKFPKQRHFLAVFFISFMWGMFGVDRMYLGKYGTGLLKLLTIGGFGLWVVVDMFLIMNGSMRDRWGREMLGVAEYKGFAYKTTLWFALVVGAVVVVNGVLLVVAVTQLMESLNGGQGLPAIPGLELLTGMQSGGMSPEQMTELGL